MINSDLIATVQRRLDDDGTDYPTTAVVRELNLAAAEIGRIPTVKLHLFPSSSSTITAVSGQSDYTLPTDSNYMVERVIWDASGTAVQLEPISFSEVNDFSEDLGGSIQYFCVRGTTLTLVGTPGSSDTGKVVKVAYATKPTAIANDGVETVLGATCPDVLIDKAAANLALSDGELASTAQIWLSRSEKGIERLVESLEDGGLAYGHKQVLDFNE